MCGIDKVIRHQKDLHIALLQDYSDNLKCCANCAHIDKEYFEPCETVWNSMCDKWKFDGKTKQERMK